jgi:hypothetical protein
MLGSAAILLEKMLNLLEPRDNSLIAWWPPALLLWLGKLVQLRAQVV